MSVEVGIVKMYKDVVIPTYSHIGDAGMDIRAYLRGVSKETLNIRCGSVPFDSLERVIVEEVKDDNDVISFVTNQIILAPFDRVIIPTGIKLDIPHGYEIQIRPRSGLSFKEGISATLGTIDSPYQGELGIIIKNDTNNIMTITHGDRIAQIVLKKVEEIKFVELSEFKNKTDRGEGGFGHTGKK